MDLRLGQSIASVLRTSLVVSVGRLVVMHIGTHTHTHTHTHTQTQIYIHSSFCDLNFTHFIHCVNITHILTECIVGFRKVLWLEVKIFPTPEC